jgi:hypothetical protein
MPNLDEQSNMILSAFLALILEMSELCLAALVVTGCSAHGYGACLCNIS